MRTRVVRVLSVVFALSALAYPGFGVPDLLVSWSPDRPAALEAGWGLFFTLLVAVPLLLLGFAPRLARVALTELVLAVVLMTVTALVTVEWWLLAFAAGVALETYVLVRVRRPLRRAETVAATPDDAPRGFLAVLVALLGLGPWVAFAVSNLADAYDGDVVHDVTMGVDHYPVQAALALAVPVLALLSAARPRAWAVPGWTAGLVAVYLGAQSVVWPGEPGGMHRPGAVLALCWGVAVWSVVLPPAAAGRRPGPAAQPAEDAPALTA